MLEFKYYSIGSMLLFKPSSIAVYNQQKQNEECIMTLGILFKTRNDID